MRSLLPLLVPLILLDVSYGFGIPGTSSTKSGYDTEGGTDPVCWLGHSDLGALQSKDTEMMTTPWDNKLFKGFLLTGEVELLPECPKGVHVEGDAPVELRDGGETMRTGRFYDYVVRGSINLDNMDGDTIFSDTGPLLAMQVILCELGQTGLCSPFVHEHANDRLIANNATVPLQTGDRHGNTHIHSPTVFERLEPSASGIQEFEIKVPVKVNDPGSFFAIGAFQIFTVDGAEGAAAEGAAMQHKLDVANSLDIRIISYQDPPEILTVTQAMQIFTAIVIAVSVASLAFILFDTLKERKDRVMQLSQLPFLVVFLFAAIVATTCSFLYDPKSDIYCRIQTPCVLLPLQLMYAIIIGRLWRINSVISPLLTMAIEKDKDACASDKFFGFLTMISEVKFPGRVCGTRNAPPPRLRASSIRATVTNWQLSKVVVFFTLPQIIMQVLSLTLQPSQMVIEYNSDESIGRQTCKSNDNVALSMESWSWYLLLLMFLAMLYLAYKSRKLPSLFNETESIYNATLISIIVMAVGLITIRVSDSPTTSPDVAYLFHVLIVVTMTLNVALRTMLPKLMLVWSGKPVLVSKLVTDHRVATQSRYGGLKESVGLMNSHWSSKKNTSGENADTSGAPSSVVPKQSTDFSEKDDRFDPEFFDPEAPSNLHEVHPNVNAPLAPHETHPNTNDQPGQANNHHTNDQPDQANNHHVRFMDGNTMKRGSDDTSTGSHITEEYEDNEDLNGISSHSCPTPPLSSARHFQLHKHASTGDMGLSARNESNQLEWEVRRMHGAGSDQYLAAAIPSIRITDEETPARRLVLRMIDAQSVLEKINREVMSGFSVSHEEWDKVRGACVELGRVFEDDVEFEWEDSGESNVGGDIQQQRRKSAVA